ncbi:MAG: hypothetical protein HQ481_02575 [Alphaproteobacteria bacterium]|nr:hypothetical protein [Alphaproteobacteria bacterium]
MPTEIRYLIFTSTEASRALVAFAASRERTLPEGTPGDAELIGEQNPVGRLYVRNGDGPPAIASFKPEEVLEALIQAALAAKIPLPRKAEKVVERVQGCFALRIGKRLE